MLADPGDRRPSQTMLDRRLIQEAKPFLRHGHGYRRYRVAKIGDPDHGFAKSLGHIVSLWQDGNERRRVMVTATPISRLRYS